MNVLALLPSFRPPDHAGPVGGGEISNRRLLESLAGRGHRVTVYAFNAGERSWTTGNGLQVVDGGIGSPALAARVLGAVGTRRRLRATADGLEPDVILATPATVGAGLGLARRRGAALAVLVRAIRDTGPAAGPLPRRLARRLVYGSAPWTRAPCLIANSRFLLDYCRNNGFGGNGWVVYPPVDDAAPIEAPWPASVRSIAMVGSSERKGIGTFMSLATSMPETRFTVIGDRSVEPGERRTEGNLTRVGWTGTPLAEVDRCDALLMPTRIGEAFGRAAVEAVLRRKFVLASRIGGLPEALGERGLLIDPDDPEAWRRQVAALVRDPRSFDPAMDTAFATAKAFDIETQTLRLEQALLAMAARPGLPG